MLGNGAWLWLGQDGVRRSSGSRRAVGVLKCWLVANAGTNESAWAEAARNGHLPAFLQRATDNGCDWDENVRANATLHGHSNQRLAMGASEWLPMWTCRNAWYYEQIVSEGWRG